MKPSFGLIPRTGVLKTTDTLDTVGFFARCVEDLSLLLNATRVRGDNFPIQERKIKYYSDLKTKKKWRVAFCTHPIWDETDPYVKNMLDQLKMELLEQEGVEVVNLKLPETTHNYSQLHRRIYHPCIAYYLKMEFNRGSDIISDALKDIFNDAKTIPPEDYENALYEQEKLAIDLEFFFSYHEIDVILLNSSNGSAPLGHEPKFHQDLNQLWTMSWLPVINVPKFKCELELPFGLQMIGPRYSDYNLLSFLEYLCQRGITPRQSDIVSSVPALAKYTSRLSIA
jgi:Asp-tRNA(Asn)/Glu-tRNA(Gln) amidotransferase A subunit family amidase